MCILIQKPASVNFDFDDIQDFYLYNSDGFGIMFAEDGVLHTKKCLGTVSDVWQFYLEHAAHRECFMHFRMKTHGKIDIDNCHPYTVIEEGEGVPVAMMHNGVLSTGNQKDVTMSDTWHYIQDYIRPLLLTSGELLTHDVIKELIEDHIGGSNKFALLDAQGRSVIMNRKSGVEWERDDGTAWLSNTYAWSAWKGGFFTRAKKSKGYSFGGAYTLPNYDGFDWDYEAPAKSAAKPATGDDEADPVGGSEEDDTYHQACEFFVDSFFDKVEELGMKIAMNYAEGELEDYFALAGEGDAYTLLDMLDTGYMLESDVLQEIDSLVYGQGSSKESDEPAAKDEVPALLTHAVH